MTPLAHRIVRELCVQKKERSDADSHNLPKLMSDVHCFEITEVHELLRELAGQIQDGKSRSTDLAFLPAPKTWLEWKVVDDDFDCRYGIFLIDNGRGSADIYFAGETDNSYWASAIEYKLSLFHPLFNPHGNMTAFKTLPHPDDDFEDWALIYSALALINTPKIIGRTQHMPHRGLERALIREQRMIGKFPLHAWTEIKLHCQPTIDMSDEEGFEAHLTGKRALHFCRSHLRLKQGHVEFVKSHWRGDPSLGIKQSRYVVTP